VSPPVTLSNLRAGDEYEVELVMHEGRVSGRVVDAQGQPVPHAKVLAEPDDSYSFALPTAEADEHGAFQLRGLFEGIYELKTKLTRAEHWSHSGLPISLSPTQSITGIRIVMANKHAGYIAGRIVDSSGEAIAGARVEAHGVQPLWSESWSLSGPDGSFTVDDLEDGVFTLQVRHPDYRFKIVRNVATYSEDAWVTLGLRGSIEGQVIDRTTGRPVTRFEILRYIPIDDDIWWMSTREFVEVNDPEGRFSLERMTPGKPTLTIRAQGYAQRTQQVELDEAEALTGVVIELSPAALLTGRVLDESGEPILGAMVYAGPLPGRMERASADGVRSGPGGVFEIAYDDQATSMITAYHHGYAMGSAGLSGGTSEIEIILVEGGKVEGAVFLDGSLTSAANVGILYADTSPRMGTPTIPMVEADGTYAVSNITPGPTIIRASIQADGRYGDRLQYVSLEVESGSVYSIDFQFLLGDGSLTGYATRGGLPAVDVQFVLADGRWASVGSLGDVAAISAGEAMEIIEFRTDRQGRFNLEGLTPGDWTINAHSGGESYSMDVHIEAGVVTEQDFEIAD
jgi:protocatechuate 3,4-dioxygenase beta subunit